MSSSEIIELNSSDEETEKKPKKKKPRLDAMVAIPNQNISGLRIHNVSRPFTPLNNFPRVRAAQVGTRVQLPVGFRPNFAANQGTRIRPAFAPRRITPYTTVPKIINTISLNGRQVPNISPKKPTRLNVNPVSIARMAKNSRNQMNSPNQSKSVHNLPPGITVTRTTGQPKRKMAQRPNLPPSILIKKTPVQEITLDDDDDHEVSIDTNAQIVPIEFEVPLLDSSSNLEPSNIGNTTDEVRSDKAPETPSKYTNKPSTVTEIIIEDSPVKPVVETAAKRLAREEIIIEDSPVKNDSEPENEEDKTDYNSRKKLNFSNESSSKQAESKKSTERVEVSKSQNNSPVGINGKQKKDKSPKSEMVKPAEIKAKEEPEFHETYQKFIEACLKVESSNDMKRIVEKKVKAYYREVDKKLTESASFIELVNAKIYAMETEPTNSFLHIKDIVDQLSIWRNNPKIVLAAENLGTEKEEAKQRHLKKLERALQKLHRAIQKLEEKEVDFDDDADSVYLLVDRYKARLVRIHDKICELTGTRVPPALAPLVLQPPPGAARGPTTKLQAWLNKPGKSASVLPFPDFHDVLSCVRQANLEDQLGLTESQMEDEARVLFTHCGKILQKRRQEMEWRLAASRLPAESDPAECDQGLQAKLQDNEKIAVKREQDVFNTFADRQTQLKLEGEEISDNEPGKTDKSDGSDDDEVIFLDEASQEDEAGTSKEFPKPVLDKGIKSETKDKEESATVESKDDDKMETNEDTNEEERKAEESDSTLKTLSSDSEDIEEFKGKAGNSGSERIDLESDEESSIYSVVSESSQEDRNNESPSCENSGVPKSASDSEEVIEFLDEESMDNDDQHYQEVVENNEDSVYSEAKVVDLDDESKDGDSTESISRDRIVRIDSESLDEQIFLSATKSQDSKLSPLKEIEDVEATDNTESEISQEEVTHTEDGSELVDEEVLLGCRTVDEESVEPALEITSMELEIEQNIETEDVPTILEAHSLRDEAGGYPDEESEVSEEVGTTDSTSDNTQAAECPKDLDSATNTGDTTSEIVDAPLIQESESVATDILVTEKTDSEIIDTLSENITEIEQNIEIELPKIIESHSLQEENEIDESKKLEDPIDETFNSDIENELLNGSHEKGAGIAVEIDETTEKELVFSENDNGIEDIKKNTNEIQEMDVSETETSSKINDKILESITETDIVMEEV